MLRMPTAPVIAGLSTRRARWAAALTVLATVAPVIGVAQPLTATAQTPSTVTLLVRVDPALTAAEQDAVIASHGGTQASVITPLGLHEVVVDAAAAGERLDAYSADPAVLSASADHARHVAGSASDPDYAAQWALPRIGWEDLHGVASFTGDVTLAVLDTGVDATAPDLAGRVGAGWSFDGSDPRTDANGHGTHTATIAAASADDGVGIAGVAYANTTVMPVKVLGADGSGNDSDVIAGLVWATDNGADVAVMPFSDPGYSDALQVAIDYAWSNGVVLVAAAGNDGGTAPNYPAGHANVVGVGATQQEDLLWDSTNRSDAVFLNAPGVDVLASDATGSVSVTGTSASAALTAGAAAALRAVDPAASNATIVGRLARWADPLNESYLGNGRLNVGRASTDTSPDGITPLGAPGGGPFVGPYIVATARTWTGVGSTNFNNAGNWTPTGTPTALDSLTIPGAVPSGRYPLVSTATGNGKAQSIVIQSGGSLTVTGSTLTVSGIITNQAGGTLTVSNTGAVSVPNNLVNDGTFNMSGATTVTLPHDYLGTGTATMTGGTIYIGRNWRPTGGSFTATGGTVEFTGPADTSSNFAAAPNQFFNVVVNAGADPRFSQTPGSLIKVTNSFTNANPSLSVGSNATFTFNGTGIQTISTASTGATFGHLVVDKPSGRVTLASNAKVSGNTTVVDGELELGTFALSRTAAGGTFTAAAGTSVEIGGTNGFPAGFSARVLAPTSLVTYDGGAQTVAAATYGHLTLSEPGTKTMAAGATTVAGDLRVANASTVVASGPITVEGRASFGPATTFDAGSATHRLRGDLTNQSLTFGAGTSTIVFDGASLQTIDGLAVTRFNNLRVDNPSGIQLSTGIEVAGGGSGGLELLSGNITTGPNTVTIRTTGVVNRTSGHVVGNLRKQIDTNGTITRTFEVGTPSGYAPVDLVIRGVTGAAGGGFQYVVVSSTAGDHPSIASSGVDGTQNANLFWTFTRNGTWTFTDYDATFGFTSADVDAGADTSTFIVRRYTGGAWYAAPAGVRTATSTQSLNNTSFSDLVVGEASGDATSTGLTCPAALTYGSAGGLCTATVTTSITGVAPSGTVTFTTDEPGAFSPSATCTLVPVSAAASSCSATYTPSAVGGGVHHVDAFFTDGTAYLPSAAGSASVVVSPAALTITADDQSKVYGSFDPVFTFTYDGLVNGDVATATPPVCSVAGPHDAVSGSDYPITCSGAVDGNYAITYVGGALTVTPASLTITADGQAKVAGSPDPAFTFAYAGLVNGDLATATPPVCGVTGPHEMVPGSPYSITCSGAVDSNYSITYVAGSLTVYDPNPPTVVSIDRVGATPTNAATVQWTVTFSEAVTGVGIDDLSLAGTGTSGASIVGVSADTGATRTVTVSTGASGSLSLHLNDDDSVVDAYGSTLGGTGTGTAGSGGAGNGSLAGQAYTVDKVGPVITIVTPPAGATYSVGQVVTASYSCSDVSGVATCAGPVASGSPVSTSLVGPQTFTVAATDALGNPASLATSYSVMFGFTGFFSPIDNLPVLNTLKPGQAVPVKFSLGGYQGMNIFEAGYPKTQVIPCDSTAPVDGVEQTVTAGGSSLSYDAGTDRYHYVWKTDKTWTVGSCRQLVLKLVDGSMHRANFKFK